MKIRTSEEFIDKISSELVWRKKEINFLYLQAKSTTSMPQNIILRAGIALLYAHWEGFIKTSSELYLIHVKSQKKTFSELQVNFLTIKFMNDLSNCTNSENQKYFNTTLSNIFDTVDKRANFSETGIIKTYSNLTSSVLESILTIIGLNEKLFELKYNLIDEILVKSRNEIVHGEHKIYSLQEFVELKENVIEMMNEFQDRLHNASYLKEYEVKKK